MPPDGTLWLGCDGGVLHFDGGIFTRYITDDGLISSYVKAICADADGSIWIGTDSGVSHFTGTEWINYTVNDGLTNNYITSIAIGYDKTVWLGTEYGLNSIEDSGIKTYTSKNGLIDNDIRDMAIHPDGTLWIATAGGASHYIPENITIVTNYNDVPESVSMVTNYPNPFNPSTTIQYTIPADVNGHVSLKVYDLRGGLVKTLVEQTTQPGRYSAIWDGCDKSGKQVSSGIYICQLKSGEFVKVKQDDADEIRMNYPDPRVEVSYIA